MDEGVLLGRLKIAQGKWSESLVRTSELRIVEKDFLWGEMEVN
jgi:hypothetical protein